MSQFGNSSNFVEIRRCTLLHYTTIQLSSINAFQKPSDAHIRPFILLDKLRLSH